MKKISIMLVFIFIISVFSGCTDKIETPDASTDNKNAESAAITTETEESSGSQSGTDESTAEETTDATAESAEQTQAQPVVYLPEEVLKCKMWKNRKEAGEEIRSELQKKYNQDGYFTWDFGFRVEPVRISTSQLEFTEVYDMTSDYLAENSDIRFYEIGQINPLELEKARTWYRYYYNIGGDLYCGWHTLTGLPRMLFLWDYDGNGVKDLVIKNIFGSGILYVSLDLIDLSTKELVNIYAASGPGINSPDDVRVSFDGSNVYVNDEIITYKDGVFSCEGFDEKVRAILF